MSKRVKLSPAKPPIAVSKPHQASRPRRRARWVAAALSLALLAGGSAVLADWYYGLPENAKAAYVGRQTCAECHQQELKQWQGSHHDLAMDLATDETVLADFNNAKLEHHGITSTMFRKGGKFFVNTEGADGQMADFEVKWVFGVDPLQQYMVEFDRTPDMKPDEIGRVQVLRLSWDTHEKRWFHLDAPDVSGRLDPSDDLHWTGVAQRWNTMCADCHSTNLQKNFDPHSGHYHTTFSEIDVSCETCHGPGSLHVDLAKAKSPFWDRNRGYALAPLKASPQNEIQACAPCHSRRRTIHGDYAAGCNYYDNFANEVLSGNVYHADGQIQDEVYEYGSFLQSKMYHKGIRCSDCHNPHSGDLKFEGNKLCTSCHQHPAGKYDTPAHHRHDVNSSGAKCVNCHMPETTYMAVDPRRDHSLRVPRPDLSVKLGTPNACTGCHLREASPPAVAAELKTENYQHWLHRAGSGNQEAVAALKNVDQWAEDAVLKWYGAKERPKHFAEALDAARRQTDDAPEKLTELLHDRNMPAIARATAAAELALYVEPGQPVVQALRKALEDRDPQVRAAAVTSLQQASNEELLDALPKLLDDRSRLVRTETARALSRVPNAQLNGLEQQSLRKAIAELEEGMQAINDRAIGHLLLGVLYENLQQLGKAREEYELAIAVEPASMGARTNLAAVIDRQIEQTKAEADDAAQERDRATFDKKVSLISQLSQEADKFRREELDLLQRDAKLAPGNAAIQHRLGLSQYLLGWRKEAESSLRKAALLEPRNTNHVYVLAIFLRDMGRSEEALQLVDEVLEREPNLPAFEQFRAELVAPKKGAKGK
jgi:hypothetical protein